MTTRLTGLIPATYTPFRADGAIDLDAIPPIVERLVAEGVSGLYVCGSTGEGVSLTSPERKAVAEAFIAAAAGRVPVMVHVGHNSVEEARGLAAHAQLAGADFTSAMPPSYFKIGDPGVVVDCCAAIAAAAPALPFYYYHIPVMTGVNLDLAAFLRRAGDRIPNFAGTKYTAATIHEYLDCVDLDGGRFDVLYGYDELLLPALAAGARGAVGSTFNVAAPLYLRIMAAFSAGDMAAARAEQLRSVRMINTIGRHPFHPAMKVVMELVGTPCGPPRLPLPALNAAQRTQLHADLEAIGFFEWARPPVTPGRA